MPVIENMSNLKFTKRVPRVFLYKTQTHFLVAQNYRTLKVQNKVATCNTTQIALFNKRHSVTELTFFCVIAEQWGNPTGQLHSFIPNCQNQSREVEKWAITKGWYHNHLVSRITDITVSIFFNYPQKWRESGVLWNRSLQARVRDRQVRFRDVDILGDAKYTDVAPNGAIEPRVVFIYWWSAVKVMQAPGDQRPTQPNLSNVGHYSPTLLSNSNNNLAVCLSVCLYTKFCNKRYLTNRRQ
jgi:hypothetical protein